MFVKKIAEREKVKLMLAIAGPSGSGKTLSALKLAHGITGDWSKITVADTENTSAAYYAGEPWSDPKWGHIDFPPTLHLGYHPNNWIKLIEMVEQDANCEVLILDSISHEWNGHGGCQEMKDALGGTYQNWAKVTPHHTAFIDKMRSTRLHIIATMRSKTDYQLETNAKGKPQPIKVGMAPIQRPEAEYEFSIIFDVNMNHMAECSKDRTGIFGPMGAFQITETTGQLLLQWANSGKTTTVPWNHEKHWVWALGKLGLKEEGDEVVNYLDLLAKEFVGKDIPRDYMPLLNKVHHDAKNLAMARDFKAEEAAAIEG